MQILFHQQMNIISAIVLLLFWMYASNTLNKRANINKIYLVALLLNLVIIALDVVLNLTIKMDNVSVFIPRVIGGLIFMLSPLLPYLFLKFVNSYFPTSFKMGRLTKIIFMGLIIVNTVTAVFSFKSKEFTNSVSITTYLVPFLISLIFLMYSISVILKCKRMLIDFEYAYLLTISILTNALVLTQLFANETRFIWCGSTFILILMFIVIQQRDLYRDSLTGARNRLVLKKCLDAHTKKPKGNLSVVMIDLDYFKNINDSYGHSEGDYALKIFVKLLQKVFLDNCIVIRMGGDEFLILIYEISTLEVNELIKKMSKLVDKYNNKGIKPYRIKYSCASGTYNNKDINLEQFIHGIDMEMYKNKSGRKGRTWSVEKI